MIDPNYYATETDRAILRATVRRNLSAFETEPGKQIVETEIAPQGYPVLTSGSSDEDIDTRVRRSGSVCSHAGGTAAMGKVVDTSCRVMGIADNFLRVVDTSVLPVPISASYMVPVYADIIAGEASLPVPRASI